MKNKILIQFFSPFVFVWFLNAQSLANETNLRAKHYNVEKSGQAIKGYDPISYFLGTPKKGSTAYVYTYNGLTYKFNSDKNKQLFIVSPEKFEPAYGGWCAYAMGASGEKIEIDPETFKIVNGKLYLFYNAFFNNTLPKWNADEKNLNKKADYNWKTVYK